MSTKHLSSSRSSTVHFLLIFKHLTGFYIVYFVVTQNMCFYAFSIFYRNVCRTVQDSGGHWDLKFLIWEVHILPLRFKEVDVLCWVMLTSTLKWFLWTQPGEQQQKLIYAMKPQSHFVQFRITMSPTVESLSKSFIWVQKSIRRQSKGQKVDLQRCCLSENM